MVAISSSPKVRLHVASGSHAGESIRVRGPSFAIGREPDCQLRPNSPEVSRRHAQIDIQDEAVVLRDLGSRNGTLVNGEPVAGPRPLEDGDRITVGPLLFVLSIHPGVAQADETEEDEADFETGPDSGGVPDEPSSGSDAAFEEMMRSMRLDS